MNVTDERPWFQIHLSTMMFGSLVAGTLMFLNYSIMQSETLWDYGFPCPDYPRERSMSGIGLHGGPFTIGFNLAFNVVIVFACMAMFEFFARRRFKLHVISWIVMVGSLILQHQKIIDAINSMERIRQRPEPDMPLALFVGALVVHFGLVLCFTFIAEYFIRENRWRRQPRSGDGG